MERNLQFGGLMPGQLAHSLTWAALFASPASSTNWLPVPAGLPWVPKSIMYSPRGYSKALVRRPAS